MFLSSFQITDYLIPIGIGIALGLLLAFRRSRASIKPIYLEAEEFRANMRKGQLIDIRSKDAFLESRINGSRNFPNREVFQSLHLIRNDQPIFIYNNNHNSKIKSIAKKLMRKGYQPVYILIGGLDNWPFPKK
jgi:rhodanese-related sulfurtransferase